MTIRFPKNLLGALPSLFLTSLLTLISTLSISQTAYAQQCGNSAPVNVVVVLDLSGSMTAAGIAAQKAAALSFVNQFNNSAVKPLIAVETMNSLCSGPTSCYQSGLVNARIVAPLSTNYTVAKQQLAVGSGIVGQGSNGNGLGETNIGNAIQIAQAHLQSAGNGSYQNYLILFSDGDPSLPGYYQDPILTCGACSCPRAEDFGATAAANAKAAGTRIFTVHLGTTACQGDIYLRDQIAFNSTYAFSGNLNLPMVFDTLSDELVCDDGQTCTVDTCDQTTHTCQFVELDQDADGRGDCTDLCFGNQSLVGQPCDGPDADNCATGTYFCPVNGVLSCSDTAAFDDRDHDGISDCTDGCPDDANKTSPGACGCGVADTDSDGDGTPNCHDQCPNNPGKVTPGICGCATLDTDTDGDGTPNCNDQCPNDPAKIVPGSCGCGVPQTDSDNDGTPNCLDQCPNDASKVAPGRCGCGIADTDSDNDGTPNCLDQCPADPQKITPGICGCGITDSNINNSGQVVCQDACPNDPNKTAPGVCGCGVPDADTDGDGTFDCQDLCPNNAFKTTPGQCGCGFVDQDSDGDGIIDCLEVNTQGGGQCSQIDIKGYTSALSTILTQQSTQVSRLLSELNLRNLKCSNRNAIRNFTRRAKTTSRKSNTGNTQTISSLPPAVLTACPSSLGCQAAPITLTDKSYLKRSETFRNLVNQAVALRLTCLEGGVCEGDAAGCAERAALRQRIANRERTNARRLHTRNRNTLKVIPRTTFQCGTR